ncbi:MAG TPA: hypothetical protein VHZ02_07690 [Acidimicrobiales bacterium]|nr:hypothetical protein [Acidimicrobiales bacterium]
MASTPVGLGVDPLELAAQSTTPAEAVELQHADRRIADSPYPNQ